MLPSLKPVLETRMRHRSAPPPPPRASKGPPPLGSCGEMAHESPETKGLWVGGFYTAGGGGSLQEKKC